MDRALVLDSEGKLLSPCPADRARRLVAAGRARVVSEEPLTIQLAYATAGAPHRKESLAPCPGAGKTLLLHICCAPCSTYCIRRLGQVGFALTGFWYNPNIEPFGEHDKRRECLRAYAASVGLSMQWAEGSDAGCFRREIAGHEQRPARCAICYRLRLEATARAAREGGFDAFTTTLLISPYQQQDVLREIGEQCAAQYGVEFYWEKLRRGWAERGRMSREAGLYLQRYCGCAFSEREADEARQRPSPGKTKRRP